MRNGKPLKIYRVSVPLIVSLASVFLAPISVDAIDNPDSPDLLAEFNVRAKHYLQAIDDPRNTNRQYLIAYNNYEVFLNKELGDVYQLLAKKLSSRQREKLKYAQQQWMKFRDAEFALIADNWTRSNFGSSSVISRGSYRCSIIRGRIIQLMNFVKNY